MSGLLQLVRFQAHRDKLVLPLWVGGIAVLGFATATAVATQFGDTPSRTAIITVATSSPAFLFVRGVPDGTSTGAVVFFQGYAFTAVLAALMSTFLAVRHTRTDEGLGRAELLGSTPHWRSAPLIATLVLAAAANLVLAGTVGAGFIAAGLPVIGSLMAGAAVGSVGLFFGAVGAVVAQAMPSGRSANGAAAALVGVSYLMRGVGDAVGTPGADLQHVTSSWISLLSPIGWGQRSRPFTAADPLPLLVLLAAAVLLASASVLVRERRDLDAALLSRRYGKERAGLGGGSLFGLAWRLQRSTIVGWCVGAGVLGALAGAFGPIVRDAMSGSSALQDLISRLVPGVHVDAVDLFITALLGIVGVLAAASGIQAVLRMRAEETEGRAEFLLSTPQSVERWLGANVLVAAGSAVLVTMAGGTAAAVGLGLSGTAPQRAGYLLPAALAHAPAAFVFLAVTALAFSIAPRLSVPLGWGILAVSLVLDQFGDFFRVPGWLVSLSPFRHSSAMPVEDFNVAGAIALTAVATALALSSVARIRRRDLTT